MGAGRARRWVEQLVQAARERARALADSGKEPPVDATARSTRRWLALVILVPLLCVAATAYTVRLWSAALDAAALSIATNGAPSVAYLATARDRVRLIEQRVLGAAPVSVPVDWEAVAALREEFERAVVAYRTTEDYPGEYVAWQAMHARSKEFFAAIDDVLASEKGGQKPSAEAMKRVRGAADALYLATTTVLDINQREVDAAP